MINFANFTHVIWHALLLRLYLLTQMLVNAYLYVISAYIVLLRHWKVDLILIRYVKFLCGKKFIKH